MKKVFVIAYSNYLDFLSKFGVGGAHPGGINLTKEIIKHEKLSSTTHILDVGCGTGQTAAYLAEHYGANVFGIDHNPLMVQKAKKRMKKNHLPVIISEGSVEQIPLPDQKFDLILSESVLSFVDISKALKEIYRSLKNDGRFIAIEFTVTQQIDKQIEQEIQQFYGFDAFFTKKDWVTCLNKAGFNNIRILKNNSIHSDPEFHYSRNIRPELYEIMNKHYDLHMKYKEILDYRIYSCTK